MTTVAAGIQQEESQALRWGVYLMTFAAVAFIGYAVIFFARNFTGDFLELGIGPDQIASGKDEIKAFDNDLYHYISHLHIAVSAFIASTGLAVAALAWFGVRSRQMWAWVAAVAAPVLALLVALPAHYPWGFATIGHLGLIYLATFIFVIGAALSLKALLDEGR
jgi:hypothetical protein